MTDSSAIGQREPVIPLSIMALIMRMSPNPPVLEDVVEGRVIGKDRSSVYIDLAPFGTGIIYGREYLNARDVLKKTNIGDSITAKVVDPENSEGYIELSLKEARQAAIWTEAESALKNRTQFEVLIKDANKGGLIMSWQGISGFLPASQLKPEHYPRVLDGDKDQIYRELKKLVGGKMSVCIITADVKEGKLIFSEKGFDEGDKQEILAKYQIGDIVDGEITGAVDFGVFVKIEDGLEGLVHISELDWALVDNPRTMFKVGEKIKAKVIEIKDAKISLSIKALKPNPWIEAGKKYAKDDLVDGVVIKYNKHGALVSIEEGVAGLVHVSEFDTEEKLRKILELGKRYPFEITLFEPTTQRMTLTFNRKTNTGLITEPKA
ncbi:MAG TPA: S1 RNA-binding domain-containing protein [Candidatus Paceibacterota bacterium]